MDEKIEKSLNKVSNILNIFRPLASVFGSKVSVPVVLASEVLDNLVKTDDKVAKDVVFGLSASVIFLEKLREQIKNNEKVDYNAFDDVIVNLKSIDSSLDKFYKLIS